jgi:hypothetical protein
MELKIPRMGRYSSLYLEDLGNWLVFVKTLLTIISVKTGTL